jgi:hypothetical protein
MKTKNEKIVSLLELKLLFDEKPHLYSGVIDYTKLEKLIADKLGSDRITSCV